MNNERKYYKVYLAGPSCVCGPFTKSEIEKILSEDRDAGTAGTYGVFTAETYYKKTGRNVEDYVK